MTNGDIALPALNPNLTLSLSGNTLTQSALWALEHKHRIFMGLPEDVPVETTGMMKMDLASAFPREYQGDKLVFEYLDAEGKHVGTLTHDISGNPDLAHYLCFNAQGTVIGLILEVGDIDGALVSPPKRLGIIQ